MELNNTYPDKKTGLVVNARGGTSIEEWKPGEILYNVALNQKKALKYVVLKGIVWHQGESNDSTFKSYMPKIIALIKSYRNDFNTMILKLPNKLKNTGVISSEGTATIDHTHFDSASQILLGKRYAKDILKLFEK